MSKKLLPNRSSKTVALHAESEFRQALQGMLRLFGEDTPISDDDYKSLRKIADKLKTETDDVYAIAKENPEFWDEQTPLSEVTKDKIFYEFCDACRSMLQSLLLKIDKEQNIAGAEYYNACNVYEENVALKRQRSSAKAQNIQAQLQLIPRQRGRPTK
jgi:hypothetical protein